MEAIRESHSERYMVVSNLHTRDATAKGAKRRSGSDKAEIVKHRQSRYEQWNGGTDVLKQQ